MSDRFTLTRTKYNSPAIYDTQTTQVAPFEDDGSAQGALDAFRNGEDVTTWAWRAPYPEEVPPVGGLRPSENTDPLFAAAAEYGRTHLGWKDDPEPEDLSVLALRYVGGPGPTTVELDVQKAQAYATLALVEAQKDTNYLLGRIYDQMQSTRAVGL